MAILYEEFKDLKYNTKKELSKLGQHWKWVLLTGVVYLVLGVIALLTPVYTTIGLTYVVATIMIIAGAANLIHALRLYKHHGFGIRLIFALVPLTAGILFFRYPTQGLLTFAIILGFYFFMSAASQLAGALAIRPVRGWAWAIVGAVASFALGIVVLLSFPFSALWIPGLIFAVDLIMSGSGMVGMSYCLRDFYLENRSLAEEAESMTPSSSFKKKETNKPSKLRTTHQNI